MFREWPWAWAALALASCKESIDPAVDASVVDGGAVDGNVVDERRPEAPQRVTITPIGEEPAWRPVDVHVAATDFGPDDDDFDPRVDRLLAPRHRLDNRLGLLRSVTVHAGGYETEFAEALSAAGYRTSGRYALDELRAPRGMLVVMTLVPGSGAPVGRSSDAPNRPMLDPDDFPLDIDYDEFIDGVLVDPDGDTTFPSANVVGASVEGWSHVNLVWGGYVDGGRLLPVGRSGAGEHRVRVRLTTPRRTGWEINTEFTVEGRSDVASADAGRDAVVPIDDPPTASDRPVPLDAVGYAD